MIGTMTFGTTIDIAASPQRVWEVMTDIDRWHEWTPSITRITRLRNAPFAVGTRALSRQPKFPPAIWKITSIEPGKSFTWVSRVPGLRVVARHSVDAASAGARASLSVEIGGLLGGVWARMTRALTEKYLAFEAAGLKARSENPGYRCDRRNTEETP
jgi:hypothetical protein